MLTIAIITFREFLEAFLLIGIFIGMDKKLHLHNRKEIVLAASLGLVFSLFLPLIVFFFAKRAAHVLTEGNMSVLEGYLLIFSGFFLAYVTFFLHEFVKDGKKKTCNNTYEKMENKFFDVSLFFTIFLLIVREGCEVSLLTASSSLFARFLTNIEGLFLGFFVASLFGILTLFTYIELPIKKIFMYSQVLILIIGGAMVKNGLTILLKNYAHINLIKIIPLPLHFIPGDNSIFGQVINSLTGLQQNMSLIQISIMLFYIITIIFLSKKLTIFK